MKAPAESHRPRLQVQKLEFFLDYRGDWFPPSYVNEAGANCVDSTRRLS